MIPVKQTIFGEKGNCFQACVASILEMRLADVPHFCAHRNWESLFWDWLNDMDMFVIDIKMDEQGICTVSPNQWCILTGRSERNLLHSVIGKYKEYGQFTLEFDPHPDGKFFVDDKILWAMFVGRKI